MSLATARKTTLQHREMLSMGKDPLAKTRARSVPTFGQLADEYIRTHASSWRNETHRAQWVMTLKRHAAPLRSMRVNDVKVDDVVRILSPIWTTRPETASRLRGRIEAVLDAAKARGYRDGENPAGWRGNLKHLLPRRQKLTRGHHAALPFAELPQFIRQLETSNQHCSPRSPIYNIDRRACWGGARGTLGRIRFAVGLMDRARTPHEGGART